MYQAARESGFQYDTRRSPTRSLRLIWALIALLFTGCQSPTVNTPTLESNVTNIPQSLELSAAQVPISTLPISEPPATWTIAPAATIPTWTPQQTIQELTLTPSATESPRPVPSVTPSDEPTATSVPAEPTPHATVLPKAVSVEWGEITINTYEYESALYTDPEKAGHPYPLLHEDRVGPPRPHTYRALRMRNEYLELTLLPELGGRIYQCRFLPTGQDLFYNNPVIKPSHWGPGDQGWWLAAGGMEFCLPVDEHGYVTAQPWETTVTKQQDGSAVAAMQILEQSRNVWARVEVTLKPGESAFHLRTAITNPDDKAKELQFWINTMLSPGTPSVQPSLTFYYPASEVIVHSRGDRSLPDARHVMSWPVHDGRDWSQYGTWRDWLGFFAPSLHAPFTAVYDPSAELGLVRVFPPMKARGAKLFGFGLDFKDSSSYTDNGSQYVEMWGGWTPTFWDYGTIERKSTVGWDETWYVLSKSGGPSIATAKASVHVKRQGQILQISVACPVESRWTLAVTRNSEPWYAQAIHVRPDAPFMAEFSLQENTLSEELTIELIDETGQPEISLRPGSW